MIFPHYENKICVQELKLVQSYGDYLGPCIKKGPQILFRANVCFPNIGTKISQNLSRAVCNGPLVLKQKKKKTFVGPAASVM